MSEARVKAEKLVKCMVCKEKRSAQGAEVTINDFMPILEFDNQVLVRKVTSIERMNRAEEEYTLYQRYHVYYLENDWRITVYVNFGKENEVTKKCLDVDLVVPMAFQHIIVGLPIVNKQ